MNSVIYDFLPIFFLIALGAILGRTGFFTNEMVGGLKKIVASIALPALLFGAFSRIQVDGNLALLAGIKNYKAKFYSFDRKKEVFSKKNDKVSFDTTKPILAADEWTKVQLATRQAELVSRAARVWSLTAPAAPAIAGQPLVAETA